MIDVMKRVPGGWHSRRERISTCMAPKGLRLQLAVREVIKLGREQCQC